MCSFWDLTRYAVAVVVVAVAAVAVAGRGKLKNVRQCNWKRNHYINHTRLTIISRVIWRWILSWPWNVGQRSLNVTETGCSFLFAFYSITMALFVSFARYSDLLVKNCKTVIPQLYLALLHGVTHWPRQNFANMFDNCKTSWKNYDNMLSLFHKIPERNGQMDGRTDSQTELLHQNH